MVLLMGAKEGLAKYNQPSSLTTGQQGNFPGERATDFRFF
jgi:hypothetical protein